MSDLGTMTSGDTETGAQAPDRPGRRIRRARGLPGGRAVVGALLISAAAVGVFAAFLTATAEPQTRYAVAVGDVEVGTRIDSAAAVAELFDFVAIDLPEGLAARAVSEPQAPQLLGQLVTSPIQAGDLLLASTIVDDARVPATEKLSFALPATDAVGGSLQPGERIDVLATYGSGTDAWTAFVVRGILLVDHQELGAGVGASGEVTLTVAVSSLRDVQALGHAIRTADVFVTRSTVGEGASDAAPDAYMPSRDAAGPTPDPAGDPIGQGAPAPVDPPDTGDVDDGEPAEEDEAADEDAD
jgi:hypothetical protein